MKAGRSAAALIVVAEVGRGIWDPHAYIHANATQDRMGSFVKAKRPPTSVGRGVPIALPIEYKHIPPGGALTYDLVRGEPGRKSASVPAGSLLFGTMRAYLGNVAVTPEPAWIGLDPGVDLVFPVKSEFLWVQPDDGLVYFWWAFLRSRAFLGGLPLGGGGTRPRLTAEDLLRIPVSVPVIEERTSLNEELRDLAAQHWRLQETTSSTLARINAQLERQ